MASIVLEVFPSIPPLEKPLMNWNMDEAHIRTLTQTLIHPPPIRRYSETKAKKPILGPICAAPDCETKAMFPVGYCLIHWTNLCAHPGCRNLIDDRGRCPLHTPPSSLLTPNIVTGPILTKSGRPCKSSIHWRQCTTPYCTKKVRGLTSRCMKHRKHCIISDCINKVIIPFELCKFHQTQFVSHDFVAMKHSSPSPLSLLSNLGSVKVEP